MKKSTRSRALIFDMSRTSTKFFHIIIIMPMGPKMAPSRGSLSTLSMETFPCSLLNETAELSKFIAGLALRGA